MKNKKNIFKPVRNNPISTVVMESIKEALIEKKILPGDQLPTEAELCENMGVGKSSVREAIKMLGVLGVVETRQGDGTYISSAISESSLNPLVYQLLIDYGNNADIFELRSMFEPAYTLLAIKNATPQDIEHLINVNNEFKQKVADGKQTADDDLNFHRAILEATHNPFVIRIGLTISQLFKASIGNSMRSIPEQAVTDHDEIMEAFIRKDENAVRQAISRSFEGWTSMLPDNKDGDAKE